MHIDYVGTMFPLQALCYMKIGTKTHSPLHQPLKEKPTYKIPQQLATFNVTTLPSTSYQSPTLGTHTHTHAHAHATLM